MKSISLKLKEQIFIETESLLESLGISRNSYINDAVAFYNQYQKRKLIGQQLLKESEWIAEDSMKVLKEIEALEDD